ncbi:GNAT family N-acetyltransferase [Pseudogracilibacillus auburnensis]|uniref:Acetyltransferase (GNAT) family protein n=1 Tax=Pseudogracilibacillus auburnensis TaxID=1494959 RepID=A0A2V3VFP0_9BACI|nr:GNAT family N-acetyltransferase [Pseudogracilibacillus auburnensis]PXW80390.1 acetyltransferase (GNAT) family protein [Pseudogracilibacillus auburnensis]
MENSAEQIVELKTMEQWKEAFPVMNQLRTDLVETSYLDLLHEMAKDGYRLFALVKDDMIVALAGISIRVNFYNKRHVFVYDLVTDASHRSHGYGGKLLNFIHHWASENGAKYVALESGIQRTDAHRFYEKKFEYDKWCFSFRKTF